MTAPMTERPATQRHPGYLAEPDTNGIQSIELPEAEKQAVEAAGEYVSVPVCGMTARVKPQLDWRMSDMRMLNSADFDGFAESVIHPDDVEEFIALDLTLGEFQSFAEEAARLAGDGLGKSSARSRSSKSMRRH